MSKSYKFLCPISRGLDQVGDRWTLLILRDLHAGPARFKELAAALPGIASNLLASRLSDLQASGLIVHTQGPHGVRVYELTELGRTTEPVLIALGQFGAQFPPPQEVKRPGNLRLVAVTLRAALAMSARPDDTFEIELRVDGEPFAITIEGGDVMVSYRSSHRPQAIIAVPYEPTVAVFDGALDAQVYATEHVEIVENVGETAERFLERFAGSIGALT